MKTIYSSVLAGVVATLVAAGVQSTAVAQMPEPVAQVIAPQAKAPDRALGARWIRVRNVSSDLMAWWLDPDRNMLPDEVRFAYQALRMGGEPAPERLMPEVQDDIYAAAKGLISFSSVPAQNLLVAYGSEEGIRSFEEIVKSLDKPVTRLEIEAKFVELSSEDLADLNIEFPATTENTRSNADQTSKQLIGVARGNIQAQVDALVQQGKAKVINSPRITTMNNLSARLISMTSVPVIMGLKDEAGEFKPIFDSTQDAESGRVSIGTAFGLGVTPSVQNDGTISLAMGPYKSLHVVVHDANPRPVFRNPYPTPKSLMQYPFFLKKLEGKEDAVKVRETENLFLKNLEGESTTVKVRDGQTLVFTGLNRMPFPYDFPEQKNVVPKQDLQVILLVTPKILRRAEAK